jgi:hypothetical protein
MILWFVLAGGIINIIIGMLLEVKNMQSFLAFKMLPFFSGLGAVLYFLTEKNLI